MAVHIAVGILYIHPVQHCALFSYNAHTPCMTTSYRCYTVRQYFWLLFCFCCSFELLVCISYHKTIMCCKVTARVKSFTTAYCSSHVLAASSIHYKHVLTSSVKLTKLLHSIMSLTVAPHYAVAVCIPYWTVLYGTMCMLVNDFRVRRQAI
jgi:hypothetical protein